MTPRAGIMRDLDSPWRRAENFAKTVTYSVCLAGCRGFVAQAFLPLWFWGPRVIKPTQARMPLPQHARYWFLPQASKLNFAIWISVALISPTAFGQTLEAVRVISRRLDRTIVLPGEFL